jgi:hypothetical protein
MGLHQSVDAVIIAHFPMDAAWEKAKGGNQKAVDRLQKTIN